jgi:tetratricopeptide (TPR) repeat protein
MKIFGREINNNAITYISEGDLAYSEDDFNLAISKYTKAISLDATNHYPITRRGLCFKMIKDYDKALVDLLNSKNIDDNFQNNQAIAECYLFKNDFLKAISFFETALSKINKLEQIDSRKNMGIDYGSTKARLFNNFAFCYFKLNQFEKAISTATLGINSNPNYPNNYGIRGITYLQNGDKTKAKNDFQKGADLGDVRSQMFLNQL